MKVVINSVIISLLTLTTGCASTSEADKDKQAIKLTNNESISIKLNKQQEYSAHELNEINKNKLNEINKSEQDTINAALEIPEKYRSTLIPVIKAKHNKLREENLEEKQSLIDTKGNPSNIKNEEILTDYIKYTWRGFNKIFINDDRVWTHKSSRSGQFASFKYDTFTKSGEFTYSIDIYDTDGKKNQFSKRGNVTLFFNTLNNDTNEFYEFKLSDFRLFIENPRSSIADTSSLSLNFKALKSKLEEKLILKNFRDMRKKEFLGDMTKKIAKVEKEIKNIINRPINNARRQFNIGSETNCGLVVNKRASLLQIESKEGLKWFKKGNIFPSGFSCEFKDGVYQQPKFIM